MSLCLLGKIGVMICHRRSELQGISGICQVIILFYRHTNWGLQGFNCKKWQQDKGEISRLTGNVDFNHTLLPLFKTRNLTWACCLANNSSPQWPRTGLSSVINTYRSQIRQWHGVCVSECECVSVWVCVCVCVVLVILLGLAEQT
jgi:hypothetical protein